MFGSFFALRWVGKNQFGSLRGNCMGAGPKKGEKGIYELAENMRSY